MKHYVPDEDFVKQRCIHQKVKMTSSERIRSGFSSCFLLELPCPTSLDPCKGITISSKFPSDHEHQQNNAYCQQRRRCGCSRRLVLEEAEERTNEVSLKCDGVV
jgi:hypothetical protein